MSEQVTSRQKPEILRTGLCNMQVCVPNHYGDERIEEFANTESPTGIRSKWRLVEQGHSALGGDNAVVPCAEREGCSHRVLIC